VRRALAFSFHIVSCALASCGAGSSMKASKPKTATQAPEADTQRPVTISPTKLPTLKPAIETLGLLTGSRNGESFTCQLVHIGKGLLATASHCTENATMLAGSWPGQQGTTFSLRVLETVETTSTEVESITFLATVERAFSVKSSIDLLAAYVEPSLSYPSPLIVKFLDGTGTSSTRSCEPRRYNEEGLIAYACETSGGMSGALVMREQDGRAIGIHVGRLSGLGYGAAFLAFISRAKQRIAQDLGVPP